MIKSDFLRRLRFLYNLLKVTSCDVKELQTKLQKNGFKILRRQIYRDIESVSTYFLDDDEELVITNLNNKKKTWKVNKKRESNQFNIDDIYSRVILKNSVPSYFQNEIKQSIQDELIRELNSKHKQNQYSIKVINCSNSIIKSDFNEKLFCDKTYKIFKDLFWCIINQVKVKLKITTDCLISQINENSQNGIILSPLCFIQHKGSLYLSGITPQKRILIFDLSEIQEYEYLKLSYKNRSELMTLLQKELSNRFGISENLDDKIYDIEIELKQNLGDYLKKFHWHHSQKFRVSEGGYILQFKCGINNELLGWISALETKAKIIKPERLKMLYYHSLVKVGEIYLSDKTL
jgi:hypothetical protein